MNCSDRKRQGRREKMGNNPTAGASSFATSVTATATASSSVQKQEACSRTSRSGRSFANARRSAFGVWGWRDMGRRSAWAHATLFSPANLRLWLMWPARIVHTTIQNKERQRGCTTDFVTASLTKGRSVAEREKTEVPEEAPVCKQADSFLNPCVICVEIHQMLFWPLSLYIFKDHCSSMCDHFIIYKTQTH